MALRRSRVRIPLGPPKFYKVKTEVVGHLGSEKEKQSVNPSTVFNENTHPHRGQKTELACSLAREDFTGETK